MDNAFKTYPLTEDDTLQGYVLSELQLAVLQNETAVVANQLISLTVDVQNVPKFIQEQAYLAGQLAIYQTLTSRSKEAYAELVKKAKDQSH